MREIMDDQSLIGYCEIHCTTERALFSGEQLSRMIRLAGCPSNYISPKQAAKEGWLALHEDAMMPLVKLARENVKWREEHKLLKTDIILKYETSTGYGMNSEFTDPFEALKEIVRILAVSGYGPEAVEAAQEAKANYDEWKASQNG